MSSNSRRSSTVWKDKLLSVPAKDREVRTKEEPVAIPAERLSYPRTPRIGAPGNKRVRWEAAETDARHDEAHMERDQEE